MSHTPAPWKIDGAISTRVLLINDAKGYAIGEIVDTRNPANARLISAAPDLLEALCTALPFVEDHEGSDIYKSGAVARAVKEIRNAIDKATNEGNAK
jgi:hypothetical protein